MDFISNLIKRPISVAMNEPSATAALAQSALNDAIAVRSATPTRPESPSSLIAVAMNTSINTQLTDLLESATQDLARIEEKKNAENLPQAETLFKDADGTNDAIQQLLREINENLNQVSDDDDDDDDIPNGLSNDITTDKLALTLQQQHEHVDLESYQELSPLATKTKLQQTPPTLGLRATVANTSTADTAPATAAAAASPGGNSNSNSNSNNMAAGAFEANSMLNQFHIDAALDAELIGIADNHIHLPARKVFGLSEFDESQIPELPMGLSTDLEAHFKDELLPNITPTHKTRASVVNEGEVESNSDTEQFVECQSLHSEKFAEQSQSDTEHYRSALMADFEGESGVADATLEYAHANGSMDEPMDVDFNTTMEMQCATQLAVADLATAAGKAHVQIDDDALAPVTWQLEPSSGDENSSKEGMSGYVTPHETPINDTVVVEKSLQQPLAILTENILNGSCDVKTLAGVEILSLKDVRLLESEQKANSTLDMTSSCGSVRSLNSSSSQSKSPTSPAFPLKTSSSGNLFPRSPHAPAEKAEMPFLERSAPPTPPPLRKLSVNSSKSAPVSLADLDIVSAASPQKSPALPSLNETVSLSNLSNARCLQQPAAALNSTFIGNSDNAVATELGAIPSSSDQRRTFSVAAHAEQTVNEQLTFCLPEVATTSEALQMLQLENTFSGNNDNSVAAELGAVTSSNHQRRTFSVLPHADTQATTPEALQPLQQLQQRRTFSVVQPDLANATVDLGAAGDSADLDSKICATFTTSPPVIAAAAHTDMDHDDNAEPMDIDQSLPLAETLGAEQVEATPAKTAARSDSPVVPALQKRLQPAICFSSPPLPAHQQHAAEAAALQQAESPPLPAQAADRTQCVASPPLPAQRAAAGERAPPPFVTDSPPIPTILKRRALRVDATECAPNVTVVLEELSELSAKEQAKSNAKDEKDVFVEKSSPNSSDELLKSLEPVTGNTLSMPPQPLSSDEEQFFDADFQVANNNIILNPSDFDFLLTKGNNNVQVDRSSLLLKFDPLLGLPVPLNQVAQQTQNQQQQILQIFGNQQQLQPQRTLSPTIEESEHTESSTLVVEALQQHQQQQQQQERHKNKDQEQQLSAKTREPGFKPPVDRTKKHAKMSVDVIDNDCNKTFENNASLQSEEKHLSYNKMDDLEKKIKNEVLKTDVEKKLKDAEQREEALIKRITDKDKTISKMNGVIEAYEKAIAELISEKEQLIQNYDRQLNEVKADRDSNYHHLTSLETTFSDLHVKYEKSKEMTSQLKTIEESLLSEKKQIMENLRLQEQRYEKMKSHAMQQLEIANKKLEALSKDHAVESTKLKALLKKEEISRASITEQLQQKTRENAELVKICDELINGQGS